MFLFSFFFILEDVLKYGNVGMCGIVTYVCVTSDDEIECRYGSGIKGIGIGELEQINNVVWSIDRSYTRLIGGANRYQDKGEIMSYHEA